VVGSGKDEGLLVSGGSAIKEPAVFDDATPGPDGPDARVRWRLERGVVLTERASMPAVDDGNPRFYALLDVRLPDDGELARVGGRWLEVGCRGLAPGLWERLRASLPVGPPRAWGEPQGEPGGVWAYVSVTPRPWQDRVDTKVYSADSFGWLVGRLAARPVEAAFTCCSWMNAVCLTRLAGGS